MLLTLYKCYIKNSPPWFCGEILLVFQLWQPDVSLVNSAVCYLHLPREKDFVVFSSIFVELFPKAARSNVTCMVLRYSTWVRRVVQRDCCLLSWVRWERSHNVFSVDSSCTASVPPTDRFLNHPLFTGMLLFALLKQFFISLNFSDGLCYALPQSFWI